jgi:hypothetical protein
MKVRIPQARGAAIAVIVAVLCVGGFVWLAAANLLQPHLTPWKSLVTSAVWLFLVGCVIVMMIRGNGGVGGVFVQVLGNFSMQQFVRIDDDPQRGRALSYGYRLLGRQFEYLRVALDGIRSVGWSTGQASDMRGKDWDDWSVALWCDTTSVQTRLGGWDRNDPQHIEIIGLSGPRSETEPLGQAIVQLLTASGLTLAPDAEGRKYQRAE